MATTSLARRRSSGGGGSLSRVSRAASAVARGARRAGAIVRSGASRGGAIVRSGAARAKTITKHTFNATREPLKNVALHEGVRLGGHTGAYALDSLIGWRALGGWLRPSTFYTAASFVVAALTGGKWRVLFRNNGQGGLHHLLARGLDLVKQMIAPGSPSGTAGADDAGNRRPQGGTSF